MTETLLSCTVLARELGVLKFGREGERGEGGRTTRRGKKKFVFKVHKTWNDYMGNNVQTRFAE